MEVGGDLVTHGANVVTYAVEGGKVSAVVTKGRALAHGENSDAVAVIAGGSTALTNMRAIAQRTLVVTEAEVTDRTGLVA